MIKTSIYCSFFNVIKNGFDYQKTIDNFLSFGDEVVIAVNKSEDNTLEELKNIANKHNSLKIIECNYSYDDITFDGRLKNDALQVTTNEIKIQMDGDEAFILSQMTKWYKYAEFLLNDNVDCYLVPSIDLFGAEDNIRSDKNIGLKVRIHKKGLKCGVWKRAWRGSYFDTSISDSCNILNQNDELASTKHIVPPQYLEPEMAFMLNSSIFTIHYGYLDLNQRVKVNKAIWADHWPKRSGHAENVVISVEELEKIPVVKHNLILT